MLVLKKSISSNTIAILMDNLRKTRILHLLLCCFVFEKHRVDTQNGTQLNQALYEDTYGKHAHTSHIDLLPPLTHVLGAFLSMSCVTTFHLTSNNTCPIISWFLTSWNPSIIHLHGQASGLFEGEVYIYFCNYAFLNHLAYIQTC